LATAYKAYSHYTSQGFEGAVVKDPSSHWRDHTSPYNVKLKIAFEAEYVITGTFEGQGKYVGMLGGFYIETSDGLLKSSVGTGFPDSLRKEYFKIPSDGWKETICTVIANDVVSKRDSDVKSLFLPVFSELRMDRNKADSLERVMEQLSAAKGLK
jgi:ATP-dependent DNA ligase